MMKKLLLVLMLLTAYGSILKAQDSIKVIKKAPEDRVTKEAKLLQKKLTLTDDQTQQIKVMLADRDGKLDTWRSSHGTSAERAQIQSDADSQIETLLNDDQKKIYAQMIVNQKQKTEPNKTILPGPPKKHGF